jgi:hypothetical protein
MKLLQHDLMLSPRNTVRSRWDEQIMLAASVSHTSKTVHAVLARARRRRAREVVPIMVSCMPHDV